ncbi:(d)CMP kinase [Patescibacteria group bacterium]|nr:(d)CMP kinase [Patescibacteria group bacterium]
METDVITIDGPTSSGKNSVGFLLAQKIGYQYLDSGSFYRIGCVLLIRNNIRLENLEKVIEVFKNLQIKVKQNGQPKFLVNGEDITEHLHDPEVTRIVSAVSAIRQVREAIKLIQYKLVNSENTVMTGRDIGSEIFPKAEYKFYLTAGAEIRAKRRFKQLVQKDQDLKYGDVLKAMKDRDQKDTTREISPLRIPEDAIVIDNSDLTVEQTVKEMLKHIYA